MKKDRKNLLRIVQIISDIANHKMKECEAQQKLLASKLQDINLLHPEIRHSFTGFEASMEDYALKDVCVKFLKAQYNASAATMEARQQYLKLMHMNYDR